MDSLPDAAASQSGSLKLLLKLFISVSGAEVKLVTTKVGVIIIFN